MHVRSLRKLVRPILLLLGSLLVVQPLLLWNATHRELFTRYFDEDRAAQEAQASNVSSLFDDTGIDNAGPSIELQPNRFSLGLLPSTYPWRVWDAELLSVLTLSGSGAFIVLISLLPSHSRRRAPPDALATENS